MPITKNPKSTTKATAWTQPFPTMSVARLAWVGAGAAGIGAPFRAGAMVSR
jgi:hypothetical protein